jgi:hypothetical protein
MVEQHTSSSCAMWVRLPPSNFKTLFVKGSIMSGYTNGIKEGRVKTLEQYAHVCMQAFGYCIHMRDDNLPDEVRQAEVTEYYEEMLQSITDEYKKFIALDEKGLLEMYALDKKEHEELHLKEIAESQKEKHRYEKILKEVEAFTPSKDHVDLVNFMKEQLLTAIHDCQSSIDYYNKAIVYPKYERWKKIKLKNFLRDISYYSKEFMEEQERVKSANEWINSVKEAFKGK